MKTISQNLGSAILLSLALLASCDLIPKKKNIAPEADKEVQSSLDAVFALYSITDIDMITGFGGEFDHFPKFYVASPANNGADNGLFNSRNENGFIRVNFDNVVCYDGKIRKGEVFVDYSNNDPSVVYYYDYHFSGGITLSDYRVDGWKITTRNGSVCKITNKLSSPAYDPRVTRLSWEIEGSFDFVNIADGSKNMTWNGKLTKTLVNTSDKQVFDPAKVIAVNWAKAVVEYKGEVSGTTSNGTPYILTVSDATPLVRDFTCYPDQVGGVVLSRPGIQSWKSEYHPFTRGVATFKPGTAYPREIYFGNEGSPDLPEQCDNSGLVYIKGNSYKIDFIR